MLVRLCVPFCHVDDAFQVNLVAPGAPFSASRASSNACTLTPLLTLETAIVIPPRYTRGEPGGSFASYTAAAIEFADDHASLEGRGGLGGDGGNAVSGFARAGAARLRRRAARGPRRL